MIYLNKFSNRILSHFDISSDNKSDTKMPCYLMLLLLKVSNKKIRTVELSAHDYVT